MRESCCSALIITPNHNKSSGTEPPAPWPGGYRGNVVGHEGNQSLQIETQQGESVCGKQKVEGKKEKKVDKRREPNRM